MGKWTATVVAALSLALALNACDKPVPGQDKFEAISAGGLGVGIVMGMDPAAVHAKLGNPATTDEREGGATVVEYYLPAETTAADRDTPQLELTYVAGKLMRVFNRYHPEDATRDLPPVFIEPLPGVKLGTRSIDMTGLLGLPSHTMETADEWSFTHRDGRTVSVLAQYTEMPNSEDKLCSALTVVLSQALAQERGEELEKPGWRDLAKDIKEGGGK